MIVYPERSGIGVRDLELVRGSGSALDEVLRAEPVGVKPGKEHQFIGPFAEVAQNLDSRLVPSARKDSVLPFHPIGREELGRKMVAVCQSHWDDYHSRPDLERVAESLLEPELLQGYLASTLDLALIFTGLVSLQLDRAFGASVLELDLRAERPSFSEVVPKIDDKMRDVEPSVTLVVLVLFRMVVPLPGIAVEVAGHHCLAVTADCKSLSVSRKACRNQYYQK